MRKNRFLTFVIAALLLVLSINTVWAASGEDRTIIACTKHFIATSSTKAEAEVYAVPSGDTPYITSKITLQSAATGSTSFSNVSSVNPNTLTVYNEPAIYQTCTFPITSSKDYRIKIEITDEVNDVKATKTYYQVLER